MRLFKDIAFCFSEKKCEEDDGISSSNLILIEDVEDNS
ncbi:hypothetical protein HMPREF9243_1942 [Aerococcus sp. Group 1]|nr:hypothetical protein HMPREF9243_1942 [Aerococcus sp. Group 1]